MKSKLLAGLAMTLFILLGFHTNSNAQVTAVNIDSSGVYSYNSCSLPDTANISLSGYATGAVTVNDSVTIYINFGDGTDTTWKASIYLNQNYFWGYLSHIYQIPGTFTVMMAVTAANNLTDTAYTNSITYTNSCSSLSGDLYVDANNNCVKDAGEVALAWQSVPITTGSSVYYAFTDANGHYAISLPTGFTYTIAPYTWANVSPSCPSTGTATVAITPSSSFVKDFAYSCNSAMADYSVYGYAANWRPGFSRFLSIMGFGTNWCGNVPATVTVTLPAELSYTGTVGSNPAPTVSGNTLTWNIASLSAFNHFYSTVNILTAANAVLGDTLCVVVNIATTPADGNPSNNTYTICRVVSNSFDPNDKEVAPTGTGIPGNIVNGTQLTYLVNFQNTGNDVAYNVTVKDLIDNDLDLSTLKVIKSSHTVKAAIVGREVNFRFDNINLPAMSVNEPASHGYILYSIKPKASLAIGTAINNTANIYFDYNDAIVTNTTLNTITTPQSVQYLTNGTLEASVYPNPANGSVYVDVTGNENFSTDLYDMLGRNVRSAKGVNGKAVINVKDIPAGMYMLRLTNKNNKAISTKINVQH